MGAEAVHCQFWTVTSVRSRWVASVRLLSEPVRSQAQLVHPLLLAWMLAARLTAAHLIRRLQRHLQAAGIDLARACKVQGGAVID